MTWAILYLITVAVAGFMLAVFRLTNKEEMAETDVVLCLFPVLNAATAGVIAGCLVWHYRQKEEVGT